MFLSLKLEHQGAEPTIKHNAPSWSCNKPLGQSKIRQRRTCKNYSRTQIEKRRTKYINHHNLNIVSYPSDPSKLNHSNNRKLHSTSRKQPTARVHNSATAGGRAYARDIPPVVIGTAGVQFVRQRYLQLPLVYRTSARQRYA